MELQQCATVQIRYCISVMKGDGALLGIVHRRFSMRVAYLPRMPAPQWL